MSSEPNPRSPSPEPLVGAWTSATPTSFQLPAQPARLDEYTHAILATLPPELATDEVVAGLAEALGNAIIHGALGVTYERRRAGDLEGTFDAIDEAARRLGDQVSVRVDVQANERGAVVVIADPGPGFDWRSDEPTGGLGLTILHRVFADVAWNDRGNVVTLTLAAR
jgi:anti-sigma regulatory factor (Ser/Thr protein kinase)